jgi:hypothetical protein
MATAAGAARRPDAGPALKVRDVVRAAAAVVTEAAGCETFVGFAGLITSGGRRNGTVW